MKKNKTILIVEDEDDLREIYTDFFFSEGYTVFSAGNGRVALDMLLKMKPESYPSCILLDLMMPIMSGSLFLAEINKYHTATIGTIPVIICSGFGDYINTKQVINKLTKPIDLMNLYTLVDSAAIPQFV